MREHTIRVREHTIRVRERTIMVGEHTIRVGECEKHTSQWRQKDEGHAGQTQTK
jgi:hypothetical protein